MTKVIVINFNILVTVSNGTLKHILREKHSVLTEESVQIVTFLCDVVLRIMSAIIMTS